MHKSILSPTANISNYPQNNKQNEMENQNSLRTFENGYSRFVFQSQSHYRSNQPTLQANDTSMAFLFPQSPGVYKEKGSFQQNSLAATASLMSNSVRLSQTNIETQYQLKKIRNTHLLNYKQGAERRQSHLEQFKNRKSVLMDVNSSEMRIQQADKYSPNSKFNKQNQVSKMNQKTQSFSTERGMIRKRFEETELALPQVKMASKHFLTSDEQQAKLFKMVKPPTQRNQSNIDKDSITAIARQHQSRQSHLLNQSSNLTVNQRKENKQIDNNQLMSLLDVNTPHEMAETINESILELDNPSIDKMAETSRRFLIGSKNVEVSLENEFEYHAKRERVSQMAVELHQIKRQFRDHFMMKTQESWKPDLSQSFLINKPLKKLGDESGLFEKAKNRYGKATHFHESSIHSSRNKTTDNNRHSQYQSFQGGNELVQKQDNLVNMGSPQTNQQLTKSNLTDEKREEVRREMEYIDRIKVQKNQNQKNSKQSQLEFIKKVKPSDHIITDPIRVKMRELDSAIEKKYRQDVQIFNQMEKYQFEKEYKKTGMVVDVMDQDSRFKDQVNQAQTGTKTFLNDVLDCIRIQNQSIGDSPRQCRETSQSIVGKPAGASLKRVTTLRGVVLKNISRKITDTDRLQVSKKKKFDIAYIAAVKTLQNCLHDITKHTDIGSIYKDNMFVNEYLFQMQRFFNQQKIGINLRVIPSQQKRAEIEHIDQYFNDNVQKRQFYGQAKDGKIRRSNEEHSHPQTVQCEEGCPVLDLKAQEIVLKYYESIRDNSHVPLPHFAQSPLMTKNTLFFNELCINQVQCQALKQLFTDSKDIPSMHVNNLIINNCGVKDADFAQILEGLIAQGTYTQKLIYNNNYFGPLSLKLMPSIFNTLIDLQIVDNKHIITKQTLRDLTALLPEYGIRIMKIKFSQMDLNETAMIENICEFMGSNVNLLNIDFSWCQLKSDSLYRLSECMAASPYNLKSVNFSYNNLNSNSTKQTDIEFTESFIDKFIEFVQKSDCINHIDFSGLFQSKSVWVQNREDNRGEEQPRVRPGKKGKKAKAKKAEAKTAKPTDDDTPVPVIKVVPKLEKIEDKRQNLILKFARGIAGAQLLISVHLSDNGIQLDPLIKHQVLDIFGIDTVDQTFTQTVSKSDLIREKVKQYCQQVHSKCIMEKLDTIDETKYKDHLLESKLTKAITQQKCLNDIQINSNNGQTNDNDQFIVTRNVNYPELIFNQRLHVDKYFEENSSQFWRFAKKDDCHICTRHTYTAICYEQSRDAKNEGLIEVTDTEVVKSLPGYLNLKIEDLQRIRPIIVGTVCNGGWKRKLMMLRAELFTAALISQSGKFVESVLQSKQIKKGVISFADKNQRITEEEIIQHLVGWNKVLHHKLNENYLTDVNVVNNFKNLEFQPPKNDSFIYAAFLKPGHHQFLIYCPVTQRAFVKNIIVQLNSLDFYPEYPRLFEKYKMKKPKPNVWREWIENTDDSNNITCMNDFTSGTCNLSFVKDEDQLQKLYRIIQENFEMLQIFFLEMSVRSHSYPKIQFLNIQAAFLEAQEFLEPDELQRSVIEIQYITATQKQKEKGLKGSLNRAGLFEMIVRCALQNYGKLDLISKLPQFFTNYIMKTVRQSTIIPIRKLMRRNKVLNNYLVDNQVHIQRIYKEKIASPPYIFGFKQAEILLNNAGLFLSHEEIRMCFVFAQMTVNNELVDNKEYNLLHYVEFLDFLCRVSIAIDLKGKTRPSNTANSSAYGKSRSSRRGTKLLNLPEALEVAKQPSIYQLSTPLESLVHELLCKIVEQRYEEELDTPETLTLKSPNDSESDNESNSNSD